MSPGLLARATDRTPMIGHDGRSGASLERALLDDGRRVVVKTTSPSRDLAMLVTDDTDGRERRLWQNRTLDALPSGVEHAILDAHLDQDGQIVTVMEDVGDHVVGWDDRLTGEDSTRIVDAIARIHLAFGRLPPAALMPVERWLTMLTPAVMARHADGPNPIARSAVNGWRCFTELVPPSVAREIAAIHADPGPFAERLRAQGVTLAHGDVWPVNLALRDSGVVLLDWGLATAAPGVIDLATFVTASQGVTDAAPDALVDQYVEATRQTPGAVADGFLAALCVFGWDTALAASGTGGPAALARGRLDWWIARSS